MTCQEFAAALDPYLDDELSVLEVLRVQGHLRSCGRCQAIMEAEAAFHALLAADAIQEQPPPALRERILQRVDAATSAASPSGSARRRRRVRAAVLGAPIALVGLLLVALMVPGVRGPREVPRFALEVAAQHRMYSEGAEPILDLTTTDLSRLTGWLAEQVGFPVKAPRVDRPNEHLVGGRVSRADGSLAAHLLYEWGGQRLSLLVMPPPPTRPEGAERVIDGVEIYTLVLHGTTITWWEDGGRLYVAASAASPAALEEFALLCVRNGGPGEPRVLVPKARDG